MSVESNSDRDTLKLPMPTPTPMPMPIPIMTKSEITVTRKSSVWQASYKNRCLLMSVPEDVAELVGIRAGDKLLVTGNADGTVRMVKADKVG